MATFGLKCNVSFIILSFTLGQRSAIISTKLLTFTPTSYIQDRLVRHFFGGKHIWTDSQAINYEFNCNDEIFAMDGNVTMSDYNFQMVGTDMTQWLYNVIVHMTQLNTLLRCHSYLFISFSQVNQI